MQWQKEEAKIESQPKKVEESQKICIDLVSSDSLTPKFAAKNGFEAPEEMKCDQSAFR